MSWEIGNQDVPIKPSTWEYLNSVKGNLSEHQARLWLAKYFRSNIGILYEMLASPDYPLLPIQEILIKSLFLRDSGIVVAARGFSKSWLLGICSLLIPILSPGAGICLISANFRGARRILEGAEKIVHSPKAVLLQQCFTTALRRNNDVYKWNVANGSEVFALPLNPEGLRGHRATWLFIDEGLLISKEIQDSILRPFLSVQQNAGEAMKIREIEDEAIKLGIITEKDRLPPPRNKFFVFSSASFKFQYLYELWNGEGGFVNTIMNPKDRHKKNKSNAMAMRFSYKVLEELPGHAFLDMTQIEAAKEAGGENSDYFQREYMAMFPDISDGYFNIKKLHECSIPFGDSPSLQLRGNRSYEYVLAIDPAYSDSKIGDHFAMSIFLLNREERKLFLVHSYTNIGGDLKAHYKYLHYLLKSFNIVFIIIDRSGDEFLKGWNESLIAQEAGLQVGFLEVDLEKDQSHELHEEYLNAKNQYNFLSKRIVYRQSFASLSQRKMNEHLKNQIEAKKVWFGSRLPIDEKHTNICQEIITSFKLDIKDLQETPTDKDYIASNFLDKQNKWIDETKSQTALIHIKTSALGTLSYDLPQSIKKSTSENRPRKDSYTCLLMGTIAAMHYFNIMSTEQRQIQNTFSPIVIR